MKKIIKLIILVFVLFIGIRVNASSDYYKDIKITFNHNGCDNNYKDSVVIQLFRDNEKVEGQEVTLNAENNFTHTYKDLLIFKPESPVEIKYDVRVLEDGKYKRISPKNSTHETARIQKWVQVLPEDIKPGHTYVITTDNWNYENNGFSKTIYLRGDITAKGAPVVAEYNIIDGKQSYYIIDGEPIDNTRWTVSSVPSDDPDYDTFKDYLIFTNETEGKQLALTGYIQGDDSVNFIFKRSGKNGFVESENAMYTNKVTLTPVPGSKGRFYIGTKNLLPEPNNMMQYITLSGQNQYQAGSNMERAAQFKAYEYVDKEIEVGVIVNIEESLCKKDTVVIDKDSEFTRSINVNFDCSKCEKEKEKGIVIQLFADGEKVEDEKHTLNNDSGLSYTFENLPIFNDDMTKEIEYEVKVYRSGKYYPISEDDFVYRKEKIIGWMQVFPEDIKANNTYVLITENRNYQSNGFSRFVYLRGDVTAKGANIKKDYNEVNDKKTFYSLEGEPIENTKWTVSNVPSDDPDYSTFKDYLMFTNETEDKKLALTGYINGDNVNFIYKRSGKNGFIDSENAMYTNKVLITKADDIKGTFYISTKNLLPEPNNANQYIGFNNQNQFIATSQKESASEFLAFAYGEKERTVYSTVNIESSICEVLNRYKIVNPNTGYKSLIVYIVVVIIGSVLGYFYFNKKNTIQEL